MIDKLIAFSARNGFIVVLLILAITGGGVWAIRQTPIDAIPDLSDVQVIISANWEGRGPTLVEDQVTYPIVTALLSAPHVKVVRGFSYFDVVVRLRHLRRRHGPVLGPQPRAGVPQRPAGPAAGRASRPCSGPTRRASAGGSSTRSSTAPARHDLARLRTLNDWYVQYWLRSVPGVAEVAPVGGYVKQYQVEIDPNALRRLQHLDRRRDRRHSAEQQRRRWPRRRVDRPRVHGPRPRLSHRRGRHRAWSASAPGPTARPCSSGTSAACRSGPTCAAAWRTSTARATSPAASS